VIAQAVALVVPIRRDAQIAFTLSASFGIAAATSVPLLIDSLPSGARDLPLPIAAFSLMLGIQLTVLYGLIALGGLRLARRRGIEPTPFLNGLERTSDAVRRHVVAFSAGLVLGILLVASVAAIQRLAPGTLPQLLHPPSVGSAIAASIAGSIGEEILFRLFLLSLLLWLLPRRGWVTWLSVVISSLAFSAAHAPGLVFLYGGLTNVPFISWGWIIGLNGLLGAAFAVAYLRAGIVAAILAHFGTDLVWHVASQVFA
jgi:membrane protease YdiL (CAAX protease family)